LQVLSHLLKPQCVRGLHLLTALRFLVQPCLQHCTPLLQWKAMLCLNKLATNKTTRTCIASIWTCEAVGLERIPGPESRPMSCARIWLRLGVLDESITLPPIQYRPCFLPSPALMTASPSKFSVYGSKSGPRTSCAIEV
jgi:hypothetical protein